MRTAYAEGKKAVEAKDWATAIRWLTTAALQDDRNPDVHNLLGYAYRNTGKFAEAFRHYDSALRLYPRHRGAHEYIGEAYLLTHDLSKAEQHLAALAPAYCRVRSTRTSKERSTNTRVSAREAATIRPKRSTDKFFCAVYRRVFRLRPPTLPRSRAGSAIRAIGAAVPVAPRRTARTRCRARPCTPPTSCCVISVISSAAKARCVAARTS